MCRLQELNTEWSRFLNPLLSDASWASLLANTKSVYQSQNVYPPAALLFNAFNSCPVNKLKVVILGQDPYYNAGQANGLSFSVPKQLPLPPSLKTIFNELHQDIETFKIPKHGDLTAWAHQGVLLLNAILTVQSKKPGSHKFLNWETWTNAVIQHISLNRNHIVFMLWGNYARKKNIFINPHKHFVLEAAHPSPLARGAFKGCRHFSLCNSYLKTHHQTVIDWNLPD
ncbi:MAG: uracil-DNA glycosylase [Bacteroidia bacterium]